MELRSKPAALVVAEKTDNCFSSSRLVQAGHSAFLSLCTMISN